MRTPCELSARSSAYDGSSAPIRSDPIVGPAVTWQCHAERNGSAHGIRHKDGPFKGQRRLSIENKCRRRRRRFPSALALALVPALAGLRSDLPVRPIWADPTCPCISYCLLSEQTAPIRSEPIETSRQSGAFSRLFALHIGDHYYPFYDGFSQLSQTADKACCFPSALQKAVCLAESRRVQRAKGRPGCSKQSLIESISGSVYRGTRCFACCDKPFV